ncbi:MAG: LytTR family DNA-binding domain-containing protein [Bacteroidetes bacterium]|nr:LytTR family DNA-binding domain-containing protein [Bacteroidota bacterium]MBU1115923.1 LytTR family DNA-binding domain-containing protein [Bacteroidota bacterium]MBU1798480.1 LytTR family DNA-binding domain-containing protein [Bacteroidota bacterium]
MKLKCLIIDDEPMALDIVKDYVNKVPFLELSQSYRDSLKALHYLQHNKVDLIFLDINMPDLTGIQFLKSLIHQPLVIFTTAYSEYAVESYDFNAVDYLLKPIEFDRFLKAANRALEQFQQNEIPLVKTESIIDTAKSIMVKSGFDIHNIQTNEIIYVESAGNYVTFYLKQQKVMSLLSMTKILEMLPQNKFFRIHKSFIVNLSFITKIERHQVTLEKSKIPIGKIYRESFLQAIKRSPNK